MNEKFMEVSVKDNHANCMLRGSMNQLEIPIHMDLKLNLHGNMNLNEAKMQDGIILRQWLEYTPQAVHKIGNLHIFKQILDPTKRNRMRADKACIVRVLESGLIDHTGVDSVSYLWIYIVGLKILYRWPSLLFCYYIY